MNDIANTARPDNIPDLASYRRAKSKISTPLPPGRSGWVAEIQSHQLKIETAIGGILTHAMVIGDVLTKAKIELKAVAGHGSWGPFLQDCALSDRTAEIYMQLAAGRAVIEEAMANPQRAANLSIRGALKLLPSKKPTRTSQDTTTKTSTPAAQKDPYSVEALRKLSGNERARLIANLVIGIADVPAVVRADIAQHAVNQKQLAVVETYDMHRARAQCLGVIRTVLSTRANPHKQIDEIKTAFVSMDLKANGFKGTAKSDTGPTSGPGQDDSPITKPLIH
jgi:hypothetical protein